jgi:hypothetical protein
MGQSRPIEIAGHPYDPDTLELLRSVLDDVWIELTVLQRNQLPRSTIADRLLRAAAAGERDRDVLRTCALDESDSSIALDQPEARPI